MEPRELSFQNFDEVKAEVNRLHTQGHDRAGKWDLAQVLDHLGYFMKGAVEGYQFKVPWILKAMLGRIVLKRILTQKRMKRAVYTPQKPLPAPGANEAPAVARFLETLQQFANYQGEYVPSPFFGKLTRAECQELNLIHCRHHLGYLIPRA